MSKDISIKFFSNKGEPPRLATLESIFETFDFIIPIYQRSYAWNSDNFKDLIETIKDSFEIQKNQEQDCFLGSIILSRYHKSENKYSIIDGQQRITSFLVILRFLAKKINERVASLEERKGNINKGQSVPISQFENYEKITESIKDLETKLDHIENLIKKTQIERESGESRKENQSLEDSKESIEVENSFLRYINKGVEPENKEFKEIKSVLEDCFLKEDRKEDKYLDFILNKVRICVLFVDSATEEAQNFSVNMFNTLNATGVPLTAFEILKSKVYSKNKDLSEEIDKIEKEIEESHRANRKQIMKDMGLYILFLHSFRGDHSEKISDKDFIQQVKYVKILLESSNLEDVVEDMKKIHNFYRDIWSKKDYRLDDNFSNTCFEYLKKVKHTKVIPVLLKFEDQLSECVKLCASFSMLWRASNNGGTSGIDKVYSDISQAIVKDSHFDLEKLKELFIKAFKVTSKEELIEELKNRFNSSSVAKNKSVSTFLLMIYENPLEDINVELWKSKYSSFDRFLDRREALDSHDLIGNLKSSDVKDSVSDENEIRNRSEAIAEEVLKKLIQ